MPGVVAVDLETVPLVDDPDFSDPTDWEIFAIALAHRSKPGAGIEATVKIRERAGTDFERRLLSEMCVWIDLRDPDKIVTYNGCNYDIPILRERSGGRTETLIEQTNHEDVYHHVRDRAADDESCTLDAALDRHGLDNPTVEFEGESIGGADMPRFARALWNGLVTGDRREEVLRVTEWYATSDVRPLIELYDRLTHYPSDSGP